jgi:glycosyltransferase involved in cell wall biosynthesis
MPPVTPLSLGSWQSYEDYEFSRSPITTCHVIESLGLGGAQTMMCELVGALRKYYPASTHIFLCTNKKGYNRRLYTSYGIKPEFASAKRLKGYCKDNKVDVVIHHRVSLSNDLKSHLPESVKYVLINHTVNCLYRMKSFNRCDAYVSVCRYLQKSGRTPKHVHSTRNVVILNGVENDYLDEIEPAGLEGKFKTGRCHRLVSSKFKANTIGWFDNLRSGEMPGVKYHIIGAHNNARMQARQSQSTRFFGTITERQRKMAIIKDFDVYFYETFQDEGASMAILESLACGVPVLCKNLGGCGELVKTGVNGYVLKDRDDFREKLIHLYGHPKVLQKLRQKTIEDFQKRLHVRHTAAKYMQLCEALLRSRKK